MFFRSERRGTQHGSSVISLNLHQVNYISGLHRTDGVAAVSRPEMDIHTVPDTPPPPYALHDIARPQAGNPRSTHQSRREQLHSSRHPSRTGGAQAPPTQQANGTIADLGCYASSWDIAGTASHSQDPIVRSMNQNAALCDQVASVATRLSVVFTHIDEGAEPEDEPTPPFISATTTTRDLLSSSFPDESPLPRPKKSNGSNNNNNSSSTSSSSLIDFTKTWQYANSRLPPFLPPFRVYISTWQIICAAAQASSDVYTRRRRRPSGTRRASADEAYMSASAWHGTKAMTIHTQQVEVADKRLVVLAIRGSQWNPVDWAVNFRPAPTAPGDFLDDPGNACHAGFLGVARNMCAPIAARLREFVAGHSGMGTGAGTGTGTGAGSGIHRRGEGRGRQETAAAATREGVDGRAEKSTSEWSLLLTGHSAGGAVASLLYAHILSSASLACAEDSPLQAVAACFKRVHCVTFGAPPVSLLPLLLKPAGRGGGEGGRRRSSKSVFLAFANEGDPVVRTADRAYVHSLVRLLAAPKVKGRKEGKETGNGDGGRRRRRGREGTESSMSSPAPWWEVPASTLSNAGRLVLLREKVAMKGGGEGSGLRRKGTEAIQVTDEELRPLIFGDPAMHAMELYKARVDELAIAAVTGRHG